jgi:hypothetical protein
VPTNTVPSGASVCSVNPVESSGTLTVPTACSAPVGAVVQVADGVATGVAVGEVAAGVAEPGDEAPAGAVETLADGAVDCSDACFMPLSHPASVATTTVAVAAKKAARRNPRLNLMGEGPSLAATGGALKVRRST